MKHSLLLNTVVATIVLLSHGAIQAGVTITNLNGYTVSWDGNDGDFFNADPSAPAPDNLALASNGGVAISNGESQFFPTHAIAHLNNGFYGNSNNSHIIGNGGSAPHYMGILLPSSAPITSIAWGRDNGNGNFNDVPPGTDACGGQCDDRSTGMYTIQITNDGGGLWTSVAELVYDTTNTDDAPGGLFTEWLRHEYGLSDPLGGPVLADGVRIMIDDPQIAIDEIELYQIPEPSGTALLGLGMAGLFLRRRR